MSQAERQEFERWAAENLPEVKNQRKWLAPPNGPQYKDARLELAWRAWKARGDVDPRPTRCPHSDAGWCYAPQERTTNAQQGGCYRPGECPEKIRIETERQGSA